jgi:transcriptional regulator with XRE-family HTH domain
MEALHARPTAIHALCMAKKKRAPDPIGVEMGIRLKVERKSAKISQAELALRLGWAPSRIGNFEQGKRRLGVDEALQLEGEFKRPAGYFLGILDRSEAAVVSTLRSQRG